MYKKTPKRRYDNTLKMLKTLVNPGATIFDLGVQNPFSAIMLDHGFNVINSKGEDLDINYKINIPKEVDMVTGFEIIEHLVSPYPLLKNIQCNRIFLTVPLRLWFSSAYRSKTDVFDRHYHEFESWQFDWLLEKSGWKVIKKEFWKNPSYKIGFRPLLRNFTNRYYAVYAERSKEAYTNYYRGTLNL